MLPIGAALFFQDAKQLKFGPLIGIIWAGMTLATFVLGLLYFTQFILPASDREGWTQGLAMALRYLFPHRPKKQRQRQPRYQKPAATPKKRKSVSKLAPSFQSVKAGILKSHEALAVNTGSRFSRAVGPGFIMLFNNESPSRVFDLRPHSRKEAVNVNTRDGIPIDTSVSVTFRIRQHSGEQRPEGVQHPYDSEAVFQADYARSVDATNQVLDWSHQLCPQAATILVSELSQYTLDELYQGGGSIMLGEVKKRIKRQLVPSFAKDGIEVMGVGVGALKVPEEIRAQRLKNWEAEWQRRIDVQRAVGNAETVRRMNQARARAQIEIIQNITHHIESMRRNDQTTLSQVVTLRMVEALESAISSRKLQKMMPDKVTADLVEEASSEMQALLQKPEGSDA